MNNASREEMATLRDVINLDQFPFDLHFFFTAPLQGKKSILKLPRQTSNWRYWVGRYEVMTLCAWQFNTNLFLPILHLKETIFLNITNLFSAVCLPRSLFLTQVWLEFCIYGQEPKKIKKDMADEIFRLVSHDSLYSISTVQKLANYNNLK